MNRTSRFADILIEKALADYSAPPTSAQQPTYKESVLEPAGLSYLFERLQPYRRPISQYKSKRTPRAAHSMNKVQEQAFSLIIELSGYNLQKDFNSYELRSAYRKGLLKNHPDHGGLTSRLQDVRKCYELLSQLVKSGV